MEFIHYDIEGEKKGSGLNHRWVQPPQISYFVTTVDKYGNTNVTPVTMGTSFGPPYYYVFSLSNLFVPDWDGEYKQGMKQGVMNLKEVPECVISYYGYELLRESWLVGMPVPKGISELEVAGLTPLPSKKVRPAGIVECPINMEAKVISSQKVGSRWMLYTCEIVGVSVNAEYVKRDKELYDEMGVLAIDPLFEVKTGKGKTQETEGLRLYYNRMDFSKIERCPEDIGCYDHWIGSFEQWMEDETRRGRITEKEKAEILLLNEKWEKNLNPAENGEVKKELTLRLKNMFITK